MTGILNLLAGAVSSVVKDTYFNLVSLLLPGDGTNGAQNNTFLDSSTNNFTITRNGNTTQGTFSPFSQAGWSNYFDGNGDFLNFASSASFGYGTGDYTIEGWVWSTTRSVANTFFANGTDNCNLYIKSSTGIIGLYTGSANDSTTALPLNQWNHIAVVRNGGSSNNTQVYLNGTSILTITNTTNFSNTTFFIGRNGASGSEYMNGYISNVRVTKGRAVYTSSFTPPTSPLGKTSGGQNPPQGTECTLLTCQSNRFVDNSDAALTVTPNADSSVQAFSPFLPTAAYSAATVGGSGYFDGSGDFLAFPTSQASLLPSTGQFTFEFWVYTSSTGLITCFSYGGSAGNLRCFVSGGGLQVWDGSTQFTAGNTSLIKYGGWNHCVVQRDATNLSTYVNGVRDYNAANSSNFNAGTLNLGGEGASNLLTGYIAGFKCTLGSAVYSGASITVPTSPPSATGATALVNFTNAGITDATAKCDLETVGNAQISTTQSKFGGSSMSFDGTGDYLTSPNLGGQFDFRNGDFTIELWLYAPSGIADFSDTIISKGPVGNVDFTSWSLQGLGTGGNITFLGPFSTTYFSTTSTPWTTGWAHIAVCRAGSNTRLFVNGTQQGSTYTTLQDFLAGGPLIVGSGYYDPPGRSMNGYLDDVRITKGYARYTANFTAPTAPLPVQ